jgi:hypothetical protein
MSIVLERIITLKKFHVLFHFLGIKVCNDVYFSQNFFIPSNLKIPVSGTFFNIAQKLIVRKFEICSGSCHRPNIYILL